MRLLLVGDPHVTVEELSDAQGLLDGVHALYGQLGPDYVIFMGDLHHNHAVTRVEVTDFWLRNLARFPKDRVVLLLGNHDRPNDASSTAHALQAYAGLARVVSRVCHLGGGIYAAPYFHQKSDLVESMQQFNKSVKFLLCHQTFDGSRYENGFFAPDGLDPRILGIGRVVSGHIHTGQVLNWEDGYVHYIGSPRWRSISDANVNKCVVLWDTDDDTCQSFDTQHWCSPIGKATLTNVNELDKVPFVDNLKSRLHLDLVGPKAEVEVQAKLVKAQVPRAKVRPVYTDQSNKKLKVAESEGIHNALRRYVASFKPTHGTPTAVLHEMVVRRLNVN
jgi:DNA repair exonuclease SbcCD nuclease subunit